MKHDLTGKTLKNQYEIIQHLSGGGQGEIYLARDITRSLNNNCVIKQFKENYSSDRDLEVAKRLFKQEAAVLQKLSKHSQIPQIFDYFSANNRFFLVQELIEGKNLQQEFITKKTLTEAEAQDLLIDVLNVLKFVHQNNYIHRDIKPSNLMRNKFDHKIFLLDFGAVKEKINPHNIDNSGDFTRTVGIHTPGYAPAEQIRGTPKFCSDLYALGIVAIQALTGVHPQKLEYGDNNPLWRHLLPTGRFNAHFLRLIDKMVKGDEKQRYNSAEQILKDLHNLPQEIPSGILPQPPDTSIEPIFKSKSKKLIWLCSGLGVILVGTIAGLFLLSKSAKFITHESKKDGIAIDYPETWTQQEETDFLCSGTVFISLYQNQEDEFRERVKVCVENLAQPLTLQEYTKRIMAEVTANNSVIEQPKSITLANKEGRQVIYQGNDGKKRMEAWTIKNQKAYILTYTAEEAEYDRFLKDAEKMFKSFKIIASQ